MLFLIVGLIAALIFRAEATISEVRSVTTPPPVVVASDEEGQPEVAIDTGPARAAVAAAGGSEEDSDDGLFGRFQEGAANVSDLAGGAALATGLTDPSSDTLTILIMGADARPGAPIDVGVKADALIVLHLDPTTQSCRLLSIPRDTRTQLSGYGLSKVNHALLVGGIPYQRLVVEELLGISLDHYLLMDFAGFEELVDAVGGVPVTVPTDITANDQTLFVQGPQTFDGDQALSYARYRGGPDGDIGRIRRQRHILRGLASVASGRDLVGDVNELLPALENHIRTDIEVAQLVELAQRYSGSCTADSVQMGVLQGDLSDLYYDPLLKSMLRFNVIGEETIRREVAALLGTN
jgi:LCP family protein required for cell wall assembly